MALATICFLFSVAISGVVSRPRSKTTLAISEKKKKAYLTRQTKAKRAAVQPWFLCFLRQTKQIGKKPVTAHHFPRSISLNP
uniref:Putative secreted protein n=1 Tax=Amblyomma triste TaxID=251400 RepID=A0A023G153_AMBTT